MKSEKKIHTKSVKIKKRGKRRFLTFLRICRYGAESFLRNSWLSVAAIAVMIITLLIILTVSMIHTVFTDTIGSLRDKVDMSIYLIPATTKEQGESLLGKISGLSSVRSTQYISSEDAREKIAQENSDNPEVLEAIKEATNKTPATIRVVLNDINNTAELEKFVKEDEDLKKLINPDFEPSFKGDRRTVIESIGNSVGFAQKVGIIASSIFVVISALIIFNTIRMAIFNRKEEIQMMKLIGADRSFIRGPFLIESIIYGSVAAIIATGLGYLGVFKAAPLLAEKQIIIEPTLQILKMYVPLVVLAMIGIGSLIGIISSLFATHKYLRI